MSALFLAGCDRQSPPAAQESADEGAQEAPPHPALSGRIERRFAGTSLADVEVSHADGRVLNLTDLEGQPVLLNIWATWCAPCVIEMPMLEEVAKDYDGQLRVVTISEDMKGAEAVVPFLQERGFERLEPWLDPENALAQHYGQGGALPTTVLYNAQGQEVLRVLGGYHWTSEEAGDLIEEALQ
jgi:thiol-disulfide isomerase/thioredoxin